MKEQIRDQLLNWIRDEKKPGVETVGEVRRKCAVQGEEKLSHVLINLEKKLENNQSDPLAPLRKFFRQGTTEGKKIRLRMAENEPFEQQRRRLLNRHAEEKGVECREIDSKIMEVSAPASRELALFRGLYNWEEVEKNEI